MSTPGNSTLPAWRLYKTMLPREVGVIPLAVSLYILVNNILVLVTFRRMRTLQIQHYFMIGLALADLQTLIPYSISTYVLIRGQVWLTPTLCNILGVEIIVTICTTTWLHSTMCIEKCLSILKPIQHRAFTVQREAKKYAKGLIIMSFAVPQALCFAYSFCDLIVISFRPYTGFCSFETDLNFLLLVVSFFVVAPIFVQIITHLLMLKVIRSLQGSNKSRTLLAIRTVGVTLGVYWMCWIPFVVDFVWTIIPNIDPSPDWMEFLTGTGVFLNSGMSCIIYNVCMPSFRKQFHDLFDTCRGLVPGTNSSVTVGKAVSSSGNLRTISSGGSGWNNSVCHPSSQDYDMTIVCQPTDKNPSPIQGSV